MEIGKKKKKNQLKKIKPKREIKKKMPFPRDHLDETPWKMG